MLTLASYYAETETGTLRKITLPLPYILDEIQRTLENQTAQLNRLDRLPLPRLDKFVRCLIV